MLAVPPAGLITIALQCKVCTTVLLPAVLHLVWHDFVFASLV
jgi:hypothetical protein